MFKGSCVALVTPIKDGKINYEVLSCLLDFHIEADTAAILLCGTTGESATMSHQEHKEVIKFGVEYVRDKCSDDDAPLLIAGTGSNSTREAVELTVFAREVGADLALVITPYYNKPTQRGLIDHFQTVAQAADIPIILYNVPSRTGINMEASTVAELSKVENIVGVKEASGNLNQISDIIQTSEKDFLLYSGDDSLTLPILALGGVGVISVVANIVPNEVAELVAAYLNEDLTRARKLHYKLLPLCRAMFIETNPIPVKTSLRLLGYPVGELRKPLVPMAPTNQEKLEQALRNWGFSF